MQTTVSTDIELQLEEELRKSFTARRNNKTLNLLYYSLKNIKPKKCFVKTDWVSGKYIAFNCTLEKGGDSELIKEIAKGIQNKTEDLNFIYGLNPVVLKFDTSFVEEDAQYLYFRFKLERED